MPITKEQFEQRMTELVREYCDETEHQNGLDAWKEFKTMSDVIKDFVLYCRYASGP